jgi:hypothetical protein
MNFHTLSQCDAWSLAISENGNVVASGPGTKLGTSSVNWYEIHGYIMCSIWSVVTLGQISLNRYLKAWWKYHFIAHAFLGTTITLLTIGGVTIMFSQMNWELSLNYKHTVAGFCTAVGVIILSIGGILSLCLRWYCNIKWSSRLILFLGKTHKFFAYFILLSAQLTMFFGFALYTKKVSPLY